MVVYAQGTNYASAQFQERKITQAEMDDNRPIWLDVELFANEVRQSGLADFTGSERTSCESTLRVLEETGEGHGRWQDEECRVMKGTRVQIDTPGSGRVFPDRFWRSSWLWK